MQNKNAEKGLSTPGLVPQISSTGSKLPEAFLF